MIKEDSEIRQREKLNQNKLSKKSYMGLKWPKLISYRVCLRIRWTCAGNYAAGTTPAPGTCT